MFTESGRSSLLRPAARRRGFGVARGREEYVHHLLVAAHQCSRAPALSLPPTPQHEPARTHRALSNFAQIYEYSST